MLLNSDIPNHVRYKARALHLHPEVPVEYPGVTPALGHVHYELPAGEVLADAVSNHLALEVGIDREHVQQGEDQLQEEEYSCIPTH